MILLCVDMMAAFAVAAMSLTYRKKRELVISRATVAQGHRTVYLPTGGDPAHWCDRPIFQESICCGQPRRQRLTTNRLPQAPRFGQGEGIRLAWLIPTR